MLPTLVQSLVADLTDAVEQRIRVAFDVNRISKDLAAKGAFVPAKFTHLDSSSVLRDRLIVDPRNSFSYALPFPGSRPN